MQPGLPVIGSPGFSNSIIMRQVAGAINQMKVTSYKGVRHTAA